MHACPCLHLRRCTLQKRRTLGLRSSSTEPRRAATAPGSPSGPCSQMPGEDLGFAAHAAEEGVRMIRGWAGHCASHPRTHNAHPHAALWAHLGRPGHVLSQPREGSQPPLHLSSSLQACAAGGVVFSTAQRVLASVFGGWLMHRRLVHAACAFCVCVCVCVCVCSTEHHKAFCLCFVCLLILVQVRVSILVEPQGAPPAAGHHGQRHQLQGRRCGRRAALQ